MEVTRALTLAQAEALALVVAWNRSPLPLSATCHVDGRLWVRLSGAATAVRAAAANIGGDNVDNAAAFWADIGEQRHAFFANNRALWRFALPHAARMPRCPSEWQGERPSEWLIEWAGAVRWLGSQAASAEVTAAEGVGREQQQQFVAHDVAGAEAIAREASALGGHVQHYRGDWRTGAWLAPANAALRDLRDRLKSAFDPRGILNAGID